MSRASRERELQRRLQAAALTGRPRNPTGGERQMGAPRLNREEWDALRNWQAAERAKLCDTPAARARRALVESELAANRVAPPGSTHFTPCASPDPIRCPIGAWEENQTTAHVDAAVHVAAA